jgi:selenocysteine lyase/cysteine desulfurase
MSTLPSQRHLFDIPDELAYFNCAYYSPQLNESRRRLHSGVDAKSHPWERTGVDFFEDAETIRGLASELFGGEADGYAVVPAAGYGVSTAARVVEPRLQSGDRILLVADEFPSSVLPWIAAARKTGAVLSFIPAPERDGWTQAVLANLDKSVKVVAISTCHWTNAALIDLPPIGRACRELGSVLVVDATQSLGAMPLALDDVKPDFLVAAGYKWLLSPYGSGLLYVAEQWRDARPLEESWQARDNARNFAALADYSETYAPGARRFDVGEKCTPTILPGVIAALEQIRAWGVANIAASLSKVNGRIAAHLEQLGFRLPEESQRCPHMIGAELPAGCANDLVARLHARNIFISQRANSVRIAPHLHVTDRDIDRLLEALKEILR